MEWLSLFVCLFFFCLFVNFRNMYQCSFIFVPRSMTEAYLFLYICKQGRGDRQRERIVVCGFDRVFLDDLTPCLITGDPHHTADFDSSVYSLRKVRH